MQLKCNENIKRTDMAIFFLPILLNGYNTQVIVSQSGFFFFASSTVTQQICQEIFYILSLKKEEIKRFIPGIQI